MYMYIYIYMYICVYIYIYIYIYIIWRYLPNVQVYQATSKGGTAWTLSRTFDAQS